MGENKELVDTLKKQILTEEKIVDSLNNTIKLCQNTAVKYLLHRLQLDSMGHIDICRSIIDMLSGTAVTSVEKEDVKKTLLEHTKLEEEAIKNVTKAIDKAPNPTIRMLLKNLVSDEERHHRLLGEITEIKDAMSDEEMWDMILSTFWDFI